MEYPQEVYDKIIDFLGLPKGSERIYWKIDDNIKGTEIYLLHYDNEKLGQIVHRPGFIPTLPDGTELDLEDSKLILSLRGLIIDMKTKWICAKSFGYTGVTALDKINPKSLSFTDQFGNTTLYNTKDIKFQNFYTGSIIRVWKYQGKVHFSGHHKLSIDKLKWVTGPTFNDIFIELFNNSSTKTYETLDEIGNLFFNEETATSNFCHVFLISYPGLNHGSRYDVGKGFLVYLNSIKSNIFKDRESFKKYVHHKSIEEDISLNKWVKSQKFVENIKISDIYPKILHFKEKKDIDKEDKNVYLEEKGIVKPIIFNDIVIPNIILKCGYSDINEEDINELDKRIHPGEALIANLPDGTYIKISPTCVNWRNFILDNNHNLYNQYCKLTDYASYVVRHEFIDKETFLQKLDVTGKDEFYYEDVFPEIGFPNANELIDFADQTDMDKLFIPEEFKKETTKKEIENKNSKLKILEKNKENALKNISYCYLFAVPYNMIKEVGGYYDHFHNDLSSLKNFIKTNLKELGLIVENREIYNDSRFTKINSDGNKVLNAAGKSIKFIMNELKIKMSKISTNDKRMLSSNELMQTTTIEAMKILNTEPGSNLYALFKAMREEKEEIKKKK